MPIDEKKRVPISQRKLWLAFALVAGVVLSSYYCYQNFNYTVLNDPVVRAATTWLRLADKGKFDQCRQMLGNDSTWFDNYCKDRGSVGKNISRNLRIKVERQPGSGVSTIYFDTTFEKNKISEEVEIKESPKGKYAILKVKYIINNLFGTKWPIYEGKEFNELKVIAASCYKAYDTQNIIFFETLARESGQQSIYEYVNGIRKLHLRFGKPAKRQFKQALYNNAIAGMADYEFVSIESLAYYTINNNPAIALERVLLRREISNPDSAWKIYYYSAGWPREIKPKPVAKPTPAPTP